MLTAEVLSQGDEVVTGQIADTNAAWLSDELTRLGFRVMRHVSVGDRLTDLVATFREQSARSDVCLCTGGLGPTDDNLTAPAVAQAFDRPQALDPVALEQVKERFARFDRPMAKVNERQAMLPAGVDRLDNDWGTAPGFAFEAGDCWFACMPGVPREMRAMFAERVVPRLHARFDLTPSRLVTIKCTGAGESTLQQALGDFAPDGIVVAFRTKLPENHIKLRVGPDVSAADLQAAVVTVLERVGRWVFTVEGAPESIEGVDSEGGDHVHVVGRALAARGDTLALAESCTGGRIAAACTSVAGASAWLLEGLVTYSNGAKVRLLGVSDDTLAEHGAVSEPIAIQMAEGVRTRSGATWGIGVTGIAGPGGGTPDKPVGTVHIAIAGPAGTIHRRLRLPGDRGRVQDLSVAAALELLRRRLHKASTPEESHG